LGIFAGAQNAVFPQALFVLQLTLISGRRRHSQATWNEKIATISIRHIDNVTNVSHMLHITHQNNFHYLISFEDGSVGRAYLTVPPMPVHV
jgi:hypothetical protein